jgi:hypothetical protein
VSERWRGVLAALLNPDLRATLADLTADDGLTDARRVRALARLEELGLVARDAADRPRFDDRVIRELLAENPVPRVSGPERHLDGSGRIDRYPVRADDRRALLAWVADRALAEDEVLTEPQLNERLAVFADDVALLRRHLVDHGLVERTRSGSEYARVSAPPG